MTWVFGAYSWCGAIAFVWLGVAAALWWDWRRKESAAVGLWACLLEVAIVLVWPFYLPLVVRWILDLVY